MKRLSKQIVEDFGGIAEIARLVEAPHSTASSWLDRVTNSRLHHLRLAAMAAGKVISWDTLEEADEKPRRAAA